MDAVAKDPGESPERGNDARFVRDYRRAYQSAWRVALEYAPLQGGERDERAMRAWAHALAQKVARNYAQARKSAFARPAGQRHAVKPLPASKAPAPWVAASPYAALQATTVEDRPRQARAAPAPAKDERMPPALPRIAPPPGNGGRQGNGTAPARPVLGPPPGQGPRGKSR